MEYAAVIGSWSAVSAMICMSGLVAAWRAHPTAENQ